MTVFSGNYEVPASTGKRSGKSRGTFGSVREKLGKIITENKIYTIFT